MRTFLKSAVLAGIVSLALGGIASAQNLTDAEFKCEASNNKAAAKFVSAKTKCAIKCQQNAAKVVNPITDCYPPYGGPTAQCINDTATGLKGAENKFQAAILKACDPATKTGTDCPECYASGDCSASGYAGDQVQAIEAQVDAFGPGVFCLGNYPGSLNPNPPTKEELTCETNTAKTLTKFVASIDKCFDKCYKNVRKGLVVATACFPATDPPTVACLNAASAKSILGINKKCGDVGAAAVPDCNGDAVDDYPTGAAWTGLVNFAISGNIPGIYCPD